MDNKITIVAADDHRLFLEGLKSLFALSPEFEFLATGEDGDTLLELIETHQPDIALVDISMPGATTETIVTHVEQRHPTTHLLALTMHQEPQLAEDLLKLGLCGYVLKDAAFNELGKAIHTLMEGNQYISPDLITAIAEHHAHSAQQKVI